MKIFFLTIVIIYSAMSSADVEGFCKTEYIKSVKTSVDIGSELKFNYYYQKRVKNNKSPTFIIIPGGPGGISIGTYNPTASLDFHEVAWGLPHGSNVIYTDPRSKGCNSENQLSKNTYKTENVANDILSIIKQEKLVNYIIVGHSYGSVVATVLSDMIAKQLLVQPYAVVLSGTLGKYFEEGHRFDGYQQAWEKLRMTLPSAVTSLLPEKVVGNLKDFHFPFGVSSGKWLKFIGNGLVEGAYYLSGSKVDELKKDLLSLVSNDVVILRKLREKVENLNGGSIYNDFFLEIYCNEIEEESSSCLKRGYIFSRPFESSKYQIDSRLIYLQGENDPATPLTGARYHFNHQDELQKIMIISPIGGHTNGLMLNDCKERFWSTIFKDNFSEIEKAISECPGNLYLN